MSYRLLIGTFHMAIFLALDFGYRNYVAVIYGYEGYRLSPSQSSWYLALSYVVVLSLLTPVRGDRPSTLFYQTALTCAVLPMLAMLHGQGGVAAEYVFMVAACYALSIGLRPFLRVNPPNIGLSSANELRHTLFLLACLYLAAVLLLGGYRYLNFDLSRVYDLREEAAENLPGVFGYITPLMGKVVVPLAFVLSLLYRKYWMALLSAAFSVLIFGLTQHKAPLFYPLFLLFVYLAAGGRRLTLKFNAGILVLLLTCLLDFWWNQARGASWSGWLGNLLMRREFFLTSQINYWYYDFFSRHGFVWFANSKVTLGMLDYPYPLDVSHLIGREYFGNDKTGANTGWFGSGYMQGGFAGMLLYAAAVAAIFHYIDACARRSQERALITAAVIVPLFALITSTDLLTAFVTHGLYANLLLVACFTRKERTPCASCT